MSARRLNIGILSGAERSERRFAKPRGGSCRDRAPQEPSLPYGEIHVTIDLRQPHEAHAA